MILKRNIEFLYYGRDSGFFPDFLKLVEPMQTLFNLGGIEELSYTTEPMIDEVGENNHRRFSYLFMLKRFSKP
ncbi:MAG: hypothetical protein WC867_03560 [Candidatus Pacearchaeota archaeon]|jgi:hypothetical protein